MRRAISAMLIVSVLMTGVIPAFAFDKQMLVKLNPLPSDRLGKMAQESVANKKVPAVILGLLGCGILSAASNIGSVATSVQVIGGLFIVEAGFLYFMPTPLEIDKNTLEGLKLTADDNELGAYYKIKSQAEEERVARQTMGMMFMLSGAAMIVAVGGYSAGYSQVILGTSGLVYLALGAVSYFMPTEMENVASGINSEMAGSGEAKEANK